ncbi:homeobox-leucine zipper protein HOX11-like [Abrus precatorius]|uniref:Homeobox-leucine zipper protein HOX11-like n=1 Tax=Abrus precatorius TaxID=3816 RepID=A0A8B8LL73_ABRPR|nr:homeobox-leucine zipper protein HOX11-like [Abrus precatorius]
MELGLSLGDPSKPLEAPNQLGLGFNTNLSIGPLFTKLKDQHQEEEEEEEERAKQKHKHNSQSHSTTEEEHEEATTESLVSPSLKPNTNTIVQLDLLPHTPAAPRINPPSTFSFPWDPLWENAGSGCSMGLDMNWVPMAATVTAEDEAELSSSPNSAASSFHMDLCIFRRRSVSGECYDQTKRVYCRGSDEDENGGSGSTTKKLRLSKEQSAFLEESFKEHNTLNPKQKVALAKQLHLRPRQVEVWFQNRRARTKLKQTEVDCEYLKRCCDTLKEENKRLQKELQELRALKTNSNPFYMQLPATTLTMCPSCERVAPNSTSNTTPSVSLTAKAIQFPIGDNKPWKKLI